jgi:hypothetical protein
VPSRHPRLRALEQRAYRFILPLRPIVFGWGDLPMPERTWQ